MSPNGDTRPRGAAQHAAHVDDAEVYDPAVAMLKRP